MRLLLCPFCRDVFSIKEGSMRPCQCGRVGGEIKKRVVCFYGDAVVLGISDLTINTAMDGADVDGSWYTVPEGPMACKGKATDVWEVSDFGECEARDINLPGTKKY